MSAIFKIHQLLPYIVAGILVFLLIFFALKNTSVKTKTIFLYALSGVGIVVLFINQAAHFARGEHILAQLPLHLCYLGLIFFIPAALITKNKLLNDFVFYINATGALFALLFPARDYVDGAWSLITLTYVVLHWVIIYVPFFLFLWRMYHPKISHIGIAKIVAIAFSLALIMHVVNIILVRNGVECANYFWTMRANAIDNVVVLAFFASLIPVDFLYLITFAAPAFVGYIYGCQFILYLISRRKVEQVKLVKSTEK